MTNACPSFTGIRVLTIHGCLEPVSDEERPIRMLQSARSLREIGRHASELGLSLAPENLPRSCLANDSEETLRLVQASGCSGVCFDVNHLLKGTHTDFLDRLLPRIITTHLSDYDGIDERYFLPGKGIVPFPEVFSRLLKGGYRGPFLFELEQDPALGRPYTGVEIIRSLRDIGIL